MGSYHVKIAPHRIWDIPAPYSTRYHVPGAQPVSQALHFHTSRNGAVLHFDRAARLVCAFLVLGIQARWVASATVPILAGATWAHSGNGWMFGYENGGWEYPAYLTLLAIVQGLLGDGRFALSPSFAPGNVQMEGETT